MCVAILFGSRSIANCSIPSSSSTRKPAVRARVASAIRPTGSGHRSAKKACCRAGVAHPPSERWCEPVTHRCAAPPRFARRPRSVGDRTDRSAMRRLRQGGIEQNVGTESARIECRREMPGATMGDGDQGVPAFRLGSIVRIQRRFDLRQMMRRVARARG